MPVAGAKKQFYQCQLSLLCYSAMLLIALFNQPLVAHADETYVIEALGFARESTTKTSNIVSERDLIEYLSARAFIDKIPHVSVSLTSTNATWIARTLSILEADPRYNVIFNGQWVQKNTAPELNGIVVLTPTRADLTPNITALFRLLIDRLIHIDVFMAYGSATGINHGTATVPTSILHETRRLRIGEIHYFDHPKLGLIVRVRRKSDSA